MAAAEEEIVELKSMGLGDVIYIVDANEGTDILQHVQSLGDKGNLQFKYRGNVYNWWNIFDPNLGSFVKGIASEILYPKSYNETVTERESLIDVKNNYDSNYFEEQNSLGCGRHALNNLFGEDYFIKYGLPEPTDYGKETLVRHLKVIPIPLMDVCETYLKVSGYASIAEEDFCQEHENYESEILEMGLDALGIVNIRVEPPDFLTILSNKKYNVAMVLLQTQHVDLSKYLSTELTKIFENNLIKITQLYTAEINPESHVIGYIINLSGGHWVALRKKPNSTNVKFIDSTSKNHKEYINFIDFVKDMYLGIKTIHAIIKVMAKTNDNLLGNKLDVLISLNEATMEGRNEQKFLELSKNETMLKTFIMLDELGITDGHFIDEFNRNFVGINNMKTLESIELSSKIIKIFGDDREIFKYFLLSLFEQWKLGTSIGEGNPKIIIEFYNRYISKQTFQTAGSSKPKKYRLNY